MRVYKEDKLFLVCLTKCDPSSPDDPRPQNKAMRTDGGIHSFLNSYKSGVEVALRPAYNIS